MSQRRCHIKHCRNNAAKNRKVCRTCENRAHRKRNPVWYAYDTLRSNAKRRKKPFTISFEYFKQFCQETSYHRGRGRSSASFSVDRIKNELGYVEGNMRVITKGANSRKQGKVLHYDWEHPEYSFVV